MCAGMSLHFHGGKTRRVHVGLERWPCGAVATRSVRLPVETGALGQGNVAVGNVSHGNLTQILGSERASEKRVFEGASDGG